MRIIDKLDQEDLVDTSRIYLYGFSQACALNFRFAMTHPNVASGVVGLCGGIPGDLDTNPIYKPFQGRALYLFGDDDEFYSQEKFASFDERLRRALPNYRSKQYHARHEITDEMRSDLREFLSQ